MKIFGLGICGFILLYMLLAGGCGALCWPYTINTWLEYADKAPAVLWWHGGLIGMVPYVGQLSIPGVLITWICTLFLG